MNILQKIFNGYYEAIKYTWRVNEMSVETAYRLTKALNVPMEELVEVDEIQWKKQKTHRKATKNESAASIISPS